MSANHRIPCLVLTALLWVGLAAIPAGAAGTTHRVPEDFETIAAAIEASEWGDIVLVGPGIYQESLLLTDVRGDGLIVQSTDGPEETTIRYLAEANENEAVVIFQRCSNSTQLVGFTIDGGTEARRGILCNSDSRPVLSDLLVTGAEYGIAAHRASRPFIQDVTVRECSVAAVFVSGGSVELKDSRLVDGEKFGLYLGSASETARVRNCQISNNGQVGIQAVESDFSVDDCEFIGNGDSGIILQDSSPALRNLIVRDHPNIGIVMEVSSARILDCTIENNGFGVVSSIEGEPRIFRNVFRNNSQNHLGIEGDANPLVGGSLENGNVFLGETELVVQSSSSADVIATHNYWGKPCIPKTIFQITGGRVKRRPWASGNLKREFSECAVARKYDTKWSEGLVDEEGNIIRKRGSRAESDPS